MKPQVLKLLGYNTFYIDQEPILGHSSIKHSIHSVFTFTINESSKLTLDKSSENLELESIAIKIQSTSNTMNNSDQSDANFLIVCLNSKLLKTIYENSEPPFVKNKGAVDSVRWNASIDTLIKNYYIGLRELLNGVFHITDDVLVLKVKELLFLMSLIENFSLMAKSLKKLFWEENFEFKTIVEDNLFNVNSIQELASYNNMSLPKFKRKFHEIYNTTPNRYIMNRRVEKVAQLLKQSNDPISTIGYDCGFVAPAHLTRVFKAKYNKTPSEYRLQFLN